MSSAIPVAGRRGWHAIQQQRHAGPPWLEAWASSVEPAPVRLRLAPPPTNLILVRGLVPRAPVRHADEAPLTFAIERVARRLCIGTIPGRMMAVTPYVVNP